MDWHKYDEKLIRRGELLLDLDFIRRYRSELDAMNDGKNGRPFHFTNTYMFFLAVVRYLYGMPYRQLEGFTRSLERLVELPSGDYTTLRRRVLLLNMRLFNDRRKARRGKGRSNDSKPISIAVDSTGIKVHKSGGWMERKHGTKKKYLKIHFAIDAKTKEVVAMELSDDSVHDSKVARRLVGKAKKRRKVKAVLADGAYDSSEIYEFLKENGIDAVIKPRKNSVLNTRSEARRQEVDLYSCLGHKARARIKGYGRRWSVETAYSTFKRALGDSVMAKTMGNAFKELASKASLYNMLIRM